MFYVEGLWTRCVRADELRHALLLWLDGVKEPGAEVANQLEALLRSLGGEFRVERPTSQLRGSPAMRAGLGSGVGVASRTTDRRNASYPMMSEEAIQPVLEVLRSGTQVTTDGNLLNGVLNFLDGVLADSTEDLLDAIEASS
jgi:hypothetical protein